MKEEIWQNYLFSKKRNMVYFDLNMGMIDPQNSKLFRADVLLELTVLLTRVLQIFDYQSLLKQNESKKWKLRWNNCRTTKNNSWKQFIVEKHIPKRFQDAVLSSLPCTQTLFYFSFRSFGTTSACSTARRARERSVRKKYPFALAVNKSPAVSFLSRALDVLWRENRESVKRLKALKNQIQL